MVKVNRREKCRICGSAELRRWVYLPNMPLTDDLRSKDQAGTEFLYDIAIFRCTDCGVSQTLHDVDMQDYYRDYQYSVAGSGFALQFMSRLAEQTFLTHNLKTGASVVEVGSGDGRQLSFFKKLGARVFGYEPSEPLCRASESIGVPVFQGLFGESSIGNIPSEYIPADVLLLTYTFDHIPDPMSFLAAARKILNPKTGLLIMEVHDLDKIISRREYCLFEHEHTIYLSAQAMQGVLQRAGFTILSTDLLSEQDRRGNSLLVVAVAEDSQYAGQALGLSVEEPDDLRVYDSFNEKLTEGIKRLDDFVQSHIAAGRRVAAFGAGGRGVMTLAAMQSAKKLSYICDNNPAFHGRFTPGTGIPVVSPARLSEDPVEVLLVFSFGYINEIREQVKTMPDAPTQIVSLLEVL